MSQKSSTTTTPLRRSTRLLDSNASVKIQKPIARKAQVYTSPISLPPPSNSIITHLEFPVSENPNQDSIIKSVKSVGRSSNHTKSNNGSTESGRSITEASRYPVVENCPEICDENVSASSEFKMSTRKTDDEVDPFQGCRRSHRFSTMKNTAEAFKEKNFVKTSNESKLSARKIEGVEGGQGCRRSLRLSTMENTPEVLEDKKCAKSGNGSKKSTKKIVKRTPKALCNGTGGNGDSDQLKRCGLIDFRDKKVPLEGTGKRKSVKRGRSSVEAESSKEISGPPEVGVMTPMERTGEKKKKVSVDCLAIKEWENIDTPECKRFGSLEELSKRSSTLTNFRTPLSSIENIYPKMTELVCHGKTLKKTVESKKASDTSVKSICVLPKKTEKATTRQCGVQGAHGWTKDQELALHRAYLAAKPSPHFWKKISKLVPGKSAQECFDKVQSDTITPPEPQPRQRSRTDKTNSSPLGHFSLSADKKPNTKNSKGSKQTKHKARKTARHLLQKQNSDNKGNKTDLFSVLEPTVTSLPNTKDASISTPIRLLDKHEFLERSSLSTHKKTLSRFRPPLASPPVLKPIKNIAFHERYIDQLHCREAKRTAAGLKRCSSGGKGERKEGNVMDVIKAAKNALVCDARDMIKDFQQMEANALDIYQDFDDDDEC